MTPLPQSQIMHDHQNGRVVSREERVVDNSWLITFLSLFSLPPCALLSFLIVCVVRVRSTFHIFHLRNLAVLLLSLSQSQCPLISPCSHPPSIVDCILVAAPFSFSRFCLLPLPPHSTLLILRILRCLVLVIFGLRPRCCFPSIYPICTV